MEHKEKCGVCHKEVPKQPCITKEGTCSECHVKLMPEKK